MPEQPKDPFAAFAQRHQPQPKTIRWPGRRNRGWQVFFWVMGLWFAAMVLAMVGALASNDKVYSHTGERCYDCLSTGAGVAILDVMAFAVWCAVLLVGGGIAFVLELRMQSDARALFHRARMAGVALDDPEVEEVVHRIAADRGWSQKRTEQARATAPAYAALDAKLLARPPHESAPWD